MEQQLSTTPGHTNHANATLQKACAVGRVRWISAGVMGFATAVGMATPGAISAQIRPGNRPTASSCAWTTWAKIPMVESSYRTCIGTAPLMNFAPREHWRHSPSDPMSRRKLLLRHWDYSEQLLRTRQRSLDCQRWSYHQRQANVDELNDIPLFSGSFIYPLYKPNDDLYNTPAWRRCRFPDSDRSDRFTVRRGYEDDGKSKEQHREVEGSNARMELPALVGHEMGAEQQNEKKYPVHEMQ
ncbi:MAG: hypothetical protein Q9200_004135 [Gallowayella weberi]